MSLLSNFIQDLLRHISGPIGIRLRRWYYRGKFEHCGKKLIIDTGVYFNGLKDIRFGNNVWIDKYCIFVAGKTGGDKNISRRKIADNKSIEGKIEIGDSSHIGISTVLQGHGGIKIGKYFTSSAGVHIYSLSNDPRKSKTGTLPGNDTYYRMTPVVIGNNVWLGLNCNVVGGVIQDNVFVNAFSMVINEIPANAIAGGQPAKFIKPRF